MQVGSQIRKDLAVLGVKSQLLTIELDSTSFDESTSHIHLLLCLTSLPAPPPLFLHLDVQLGVIVMKVPFELTCGYHINLIA